MNENYENITDYEAIGNLREYEQSFEDRIYNVSFSRYVINLLRARGVDLFIVPFDSNAYGGTQGSYFSDGLKKNKRKCVNMYMRLDNILFAHVLLHEYGHVCHSKRYEHGFVVCHYISEEYYAEKFAMVALRKLRYRDYVLHKAWSVYYLTSYVDNYLEDVDPPYLKFSKKVFSYIGKTLEDYGFTETGERIDVDYEDLGEGDFISPVDIVFDNYEDKIPF